VIVSVINSENNLKETASPLGTNWQIKFVKKGELVAKSGQKSFNLKPNFKDNWGAGGKTL